MDERNNMEQLKELFGCFRTGDEEYDGYLRDVFAEEFLG